MLTVDEALNLVLQRARPRPVGDIDLSECQGLVLGGDVASDVDSPPYDKSMVDGYAVVAEDFAAGPADLDILEEVVAGDVPRQAVTQGSATRIMTGAPIPQGADAVVMVEETEVVEPPNRPRVRVNTPRVTPGQNILRRGIAMRRGETVLSAGHVIRPCDVGLLAEVGCQRVPVHPRPTMAIVSTGNELVSAGESPGPGQIRNSNGPMLVALANSAGATPHNLGIGRDERDALRRLIEQGLQDDVLVLSGGVSAGVLDLVPEVLAELGVEQVFHKIQLKPGKPLWFGTRPAASGAGENLVFGLPGNPVSSFVCFELFVRPALRRLAGITDARPKPRRAQLAVGFVHQGNRPTYHPAVLRDENGPVAHIVPWQGSADLRAFARANALVHFPAGERQFADGEEIAVYAIE